MKLFGSLLLLVALVAVVFGCADDIYLEPPAPLDGCYVGTYMVIVSEEGTVARDTFFNHILFEFTEDQYYIEIDPDSTNGSCDFCKSDGSYLLTEGIRLKIVHSLVSEGCTACQNALDPDGTYRKETQPDGSIKLKQDADDVYSELHLYQIDCDTTGA